MRAALLVVLTVLFSLPGGSQTKPPTSPSAVKAPEAKVSPAAADRQTFRNPPASYRPMPLWSWNSALDDEELRWQIRQFKQGGYGGYFMHPRVGLVTRYLSDDFFRKVRVCLEEGRRQGLQSWIYDEDRWPSGFAGGLATHERPEFVASGLGFRKVPAGELTAALAAPETIAAFITDGKGFRRVTAESAAGAAPGEAVVFFAQPYQKTNWYNGEAYIDVLNPDAITHFLKLTFTEGYNARFRKDYGPSMPGVFTDEPNYQAGRGRDRTIFPWTGRFPEIFREKRGYDLIEKLPLLAEPLPGFEQVRYDFWRTAAELFEDAFTRPYGEMMQKLGLKLTGHFLAEDTLSSQTNVTGSTMLNYLHQQVPGIDHLQRNIANPLTKKQASSVASQFGRPRVLSEIYGVSGHTATFEDLKWMADNHFALGVDFLAPHLSLYSAAGDRKRDYPPTFSYHQPYWPWMKPLNDYLGRGAWFVTRGKPRRDILLLEPLGSVWAHFRPGGPKPDSVALLERRFMDTFDTLLALHRDFDLGDEIILERHARVERNELLVGPQGRYRVVVVPPAYRWNQTTARLLEQFLAGGGRVVFRGSQPAAVQQLLEHPRSLEIREHPEALSEALDRVLPRDISIAGPDGAEIGDVLYQHRFDGRRHYYFVANMSRTAAHRVKIAVAENGVIEEWNLTTGAVQGTGSLERDLPPAGSFAFTVTPRATPAATAAAAKAQPPLTPVDQPAESISGPFVFQRLQPNSLVLDYARYSINGEPEKGPVPVWRIRQAAFNAAGLGAFVGLQPWALDWKGIKPDKTATVAMRFEFESELERPNAWLVVEKSGDFEIRLNGQPAPAPDGWHWDKQFDKLPIGPGIRKGTNQVELKAVYKPGVEIEDIFIIGDFATRRLSDTKYAIAAEPKELRAGDWTAQGYHFYAGNMSYHVPVEHSAGERVVLRLREAQGTGFVLRVGGRDIAQVGWQPWQADITKVLKPGRNMVEVVVLGSLQNSFGPLHNTSYQTNGHNWWFGPNAFSDEKRWTDSYYHAPYGLSAIEIVRTR